MNVRVTKNWMQISLGLSFSCLVACSNGESTPEAFTPSENTPDVEYHHLDVNTFHLNKVVCDPMGGNGNPGPGDGLIAELFYLDTKAHQFKGVQDFFDNGTRSTQKLFFTDINVPTRVFDTGFPSETGSVVQNDEGEDLIEYFALKFKSVLKLGPDDEEGMYELALLADDGAILKVIDIDGNENILVDNDGVHPSRFGCASKSIYMDSSTTLDVRLEYFQGPRHHISLIPMWRKVDANTPSEKECGQQGNGRYFKFNHNSEPQKKYLDLLDRGWKPIAAENWELPLSSIFNPCQDGTPAKISNFAVEKIAEDKLAVTWQTDLPATSQVLVRDSKGNEWMTTSDNILRTSHQVVIGQGLTKGETYILQGVAITSDLGKSLGRVLQIIL